MADSRDLTHAAPICFVDTETTGVHNRRIPWEVAVIRRNPDGTETEWQTFLGVDLSDADQFGLKVGRFWERHPMGRWVSGADGSKLSDSSWAWTVAAGLMGAQEAAMRFARLTFGAHVVGAVPDFDTVTMDPRLREAGLMPVHHYHLIDIETLAVGFLVGRDRKRIDPPWSSDELFAAFGIDVPAEDRHTAMGDARAVMRLYDAIMAGGPVNG